MCETDELEEKGAVEAAAAVDVSLLFPFARALGRLMAVQDWNEDQAAVRKAIEAGR